MKLQPRADPVLVRQLSVCSSISVTVLVSAFSLNPIKQPNMQNYGGDEIEALADSDSSSGENEESPRRPRLLSTDTVQSQVVAMGGRVARFADQRGDSSRSEESLRRRQFNRSKSPGDGTGTI